MIWGAGAWPGLFTAGFEEGSLITACTTRRSGREGVAEESLLFSDTFCTAFFDVEDFAKVLEAALAGWVPTDLEADLDDTALDVFLEVEPDFDTTLGAAFTTAFVALEATLPTLPATLPLTDFVPADFLASVLTPADPPEDVLTELLEEAEDLRA